MDPPGMIAVDRGQRGPARSPDAERPTARRLTALPDRALFLLVFLAALLIFGSTAAGRTIADTKLGVDIAAREFLTRLWSLWNPLEWFGTLTDQYIGYALPMGPFFMAGQLLHIPIWLVERLWLSALVATGFTGMVKLARTVGVGSDASRLAAGAIFVLWPVFSILLGSTSAAAIPGLMVPWAIIPLVRAVKGQLGIARAAALSGIAIALMGGVNAVSTLAVLILPALYIVTCSAGRRRVVLGLSWSTAAVAATAWWTVPLLLEGRYAFNFLPFIEQSAVTERTMSAAAVLQGTGSWTAYFPPGGSLWIPAGWTLVTAVGCIAASVAVAATGLAGLARRDMPERRWLGICVGLVAIVMLAGYYGPAGGPLHSWAGHLLDATLAPLRNTYKFEPVIGVAIALGCAHLIERLRLVKIRLGPGRLLAGRAIATQFVGLLLVGLALPQLSGRSLPAGSFTAIPAYWTQAAAYLAQHSAEATTLVVPASGHGQFTWGTTNDNPLEPLASSPWADRGLVPFEGAGPQILLDTVQQAVEAGGPVPGLAAYLARAGVRYILVRNDISPDTAGYVAPQILNESLAQSGYHRVAGFGPSIAGSPAYPNLAGQASGYALSYPTVEVFAPDRPAKSSGHPIATLTVAKTVLVNGGPDALLQLSGEGLLDSSQPTVIAGQALAGEPAMWAVTDGQRRADTSFGSTQDTRSYTYTANGTIPTNNPLGGGGGPPRQLLPVSATGHQTVAVFSGAANVTASSAGTWYAQAPQYVPANAFDGNAGTAWAESDYATPVGQWIQIDFGRSLDLPSAAAIQLLDDTGSRALATQLTVTSAAGKAVTSTAANGAVQPLRLPKGPSNWMRITITDATNVTPGGPGAGISEVAIPGVQVTTFLQPAEDPAGASAPVAAYSFAQPVPTPAAEATGVRAEPIYRLFATPAASRLATTLTVVPTAGSPLRSLINRLTTATRSQFTVTASSSWQNLPAFRPDNLFHRTSGLPWLASATDRSPTLTVRWHGRRTISELILDPASRVALAPASVRIASRAGTQVAPVGSGGVVTIRPALRTSRLQITLVTSQAQANSPFPVGLSGLRIPGLHGLSQAAPKGGNAFQLACGQGPAVSIDGRIYQTSVAGTIGDLVQLRPVRARVCGNGGTIALPAGKHQLAAAPSAVFAVSDVALSTAAPPGQAAHAGPRAAVAVSWQADRRTVRVGAGQASYLEIHENFNPGWTATLDGRPLRAATLDGWQQAFIVPAGRGGLITLTFKPAVVYHAALLASGGALLVLLVIAVGIWPRRLRRRRAAHAVPAHAAPAHAAPAPRTPQPRRDLRLAGPVLVAVQLLPLTAVIFLAGGLIALVVPVLGMTRYWRPAWPPWIAAGAMACAGVAIVSSGPPALGSGVFGGFAQVCALVALAAALTPAFPAPGTAVWRRGQAGATVIARRAAGRGEASREVFTLTDEVACYFDTADEPANVHLEVRVPFHLDRAAFREAAVAALGASPRASGRRAPHSPFARRYFWEQPAEFDVDPVSYATFADESQLSAQRNAFTHQAPPLDEAPAARILLASGPACDYVILNGHHAAMDGSSWLELLRDIARRYRGSQAYPASPATAPGDPDAAPAEPGQPGPDPSAPRTRSWRRHLPARIAPDDGGQRGVGIHLALLPGVPSVISTAVPPDRPTLNDALVTALIMTVGRWNASHRKPTRQVRISVPVNARAPGQPTAGNLSRLARICALPPSAGTSPAVLLMEVASQTRRARRPVPTQERPEFRAIDRLWCPTLVKRWLLRAALRTVGPAFCDTVMLTNLGRVNDPPDFGGSAEATMAFSGTAQMPRGLSVATITAGGRLQVSVRYNRRLVSAAAAGRFADEFISALGELTVTAADDRPAPVAPDRGLALPGHDLRTGGR
jgi:arabinofuranan 3-O-arabinosyltransferase